MEERIRPTAAATVPLELDALYEAYADMIYRLALVRTRNRADAEDVLQDVFFRCLRRQPHFPSGRLRLIRGLSFRLRRYR